MSFVFPDDRSSCLGYFRILPKFGCLYFVLLNVVIGSWFIGFLYELLLVACDACGCISSFCFLRCRLQSAESDFVMLHSTLAVGIRLQ